LLTLYSHFRCVKDRLLQNGECGEECEVESQRGRAEEDQRAASLTKDLNHVYLPQCNLTIIFWLDNRAKKERRFSSQNPNQNFKKHPSHFEILPCRNILPLNTQWPNHGGSITDQKGQPKSRNFGFTRATFNLTNEGLMIIPYLLAAPWYFATTRCLALVCQAVIAPVQGRSDDFASRHGL
jgi:hypothetical protein